MLNFIARIVDFIIRIMELLIIIGNSIIKNQRIIFRTIIIVVAVLAFVSNRLLSVEFAESLGASIREFFLDYRNFLPAVIAGIAVFLAAFGLRQMTARSNYERDNQELLSSINLKEKELIIQIEREKSDSEKAKLRHHIMELRNKYQLLSGKILQNKDGGFVDDWRSVLLSARKRLLDEEDRLLTRNKRNLGAGILMIAVGIFFLMYATGFFEKAPESNLGKDPEDINLWKFLANYGPIFSILVLIEIPSFFFLGLYASNERKIERNKSDLTNIDLRLTAGLMLYDEKNKRNFAVLAETLAQEDSKFVLGKNESSGGGGTNKLLETLLKLASKGGV